ncbi:MAG: glycoside hydrolase family 26 protein [Candidatus Cyclobacteriaceae bacterium M2_1C_046]
MLLLIIYFQLQLNFVQAQENQSVVTDQRATRKTNNLYTNLIIASKTGIMFGHQDSNAYGVKWRAEDGRSDIKDVCGDYPAVHGWDIGEIGKEKSINGIPFTDMHRLIKETYKRGGINSISWHLDNPVTGGNSWDKTPAVKDILPGGEAHDVYLEQLDYAAEFLKKCRIGLFNRIPIIFRPFHEHNGDWFWWGKGLCTEEEYIALFRFTVDYLRKEKNLHNLIIAFSPDRSRLNLNDGENEYFYGYPGDNYVDIIGLDNYMDVGNSTQSVEEQKKNFVTSLELITKIADQKNKVAALTESGLESIPEEDWFSKRILSSINSHPQPIKIAYFLVWRNHNEKHHYAPYPGHSSEKDFLQFYYDERTFFEKNLLKVYSKKKFSILP